MSRMPTGRVAACLITLVVALTAAAPAPSLAQTHVRADQTHV